MTEIKRQSTTQPEQTQGFNSPAEDELRLIDLLKFLAKKKVLILAVTSFCTLFSIFYAQSTTPIYRATVGFLDHNEKFSSLSIFEQLDPEIANKFISSNAKPSAIFERFLVNIKSYKFKQGVFVKGGFQKKFSSETVSDTDQSVSETYSSAKLVERKDNGLTYLIMDGLKPKVMLEFLTVLAEAAKENVNAEINEIQRSAVKTRINNFSSKIEELQQQQVAEKNPTETEIKKRIAELSDNLAIAKNLGIKNNNFGKGYDSTWPLWFQYGELALQQEIIQLRSREKELPNTKNLAIEKLKLQMSQIADLPLLKFKVATISEHSYALLKPYQPWAIVGFGLAFGLFISIFMAFLIDLTQLGAKETPTTST